MNKYAIFSYVKDRIKQQTVPVGVVAWSPDLAWHKVRFLKADEQLAGVKPEDHLPFVTLVQDKLDHWKETGQLPYSDRSLRPWQDDWWVHVRKLLNHEIQLSEPKDFQTEQPRESFAALFLYVIAPFRSIGTQRKWLKTLVRKRLSDTFYRLQPVKCRGAGGVDVEFWRGCRIANHVIGIDCLNLAARRADLRLDTLLGQVSRLEEGDNQNLIVLVCYLPPTEEQSPVGSLLEWLQHRPRRIQVRTFDLLRQPDALRRAVEGLIESGQAG